MFSETQKASRKTMEVEDEASIQQENEEQDSEALNGQQSSKEPFSRWGSGMKTSDVKKVKTSTPVLSDTLKAYWSSKVKQLDGKDASNTPSGEEGAKKQPSVSPTTNTHPTQQNHFTLFESDSEDYLPCLMTPRLPQRKSKVTPAGKPNTACSTDSPSIKELCAPSHKAPQCQNNTQKEGTQKQQQRQKQQSKSGVRKPSLPQGCARTIIYEWNQSHLTISQLKAMGSMGQIMNVTSLFVKKKKMMKNTLKSTSGKCAGGTSMWLVNGWGAFRELKVS